MGNGFRQVGIALLSYPHYTAKKNKEIDHKERPDIFRPGESARADPHRRKKSFGAERPASEGLWAEPALGGNGEWLMVS